MGNPVISIAEFKNKYGRRGWKLLIEEFIKRSPAFSGDEELAKSIGEMVADLESALESALKEV